MNPHERFEAYIKLAEFGASRHDGRREYEWKVTLGLWAAIVAGIATFRGQPLPWWVGPLTILMYGFLWLRGIWVSNEKDKRLSLYYRQQAEKILGHGPDIIRPLVEMGRWQWVFGFLGDWSMLFQLATTAVLLRLADLFIK